MTKKIVCLITFLFVSCIPIFIKCYGGEQSVGATWKQRFDGYPVSQVAPARPVAGIEGYILLSLPGNLAQEGKGLIYHTQTNGTVRGSEVLVTYNPPYSGSWGSCWFGIWRWVSANWSSNQLSGGTFGTSTGWTLGSGWTISGGVASHTGTSTEALVRNDYNGSPYRVERIQFEMVSVSSGGVTFQLGSVTSRNVATSTGYGTHTITGTGTGNFRIIPTSGFTGSIDNVTIEQDLTLFFNHLAPSETHGVGFASQNNLQVSATGTVLPAAANYVTDVVIGTETKKAIWFDDTSLFTPITGTSNGRWLEVIRIKNFNTNQMEVKWAHSFNGSLNDNFWGTVTPPILAPGFWAGRIEVFNRPPDGSTGTFTSAGTVSAGNHLMGFTGPTGKSIPFNDTYFRMVSTDPATGLSIYNPGSSAGSWLAHVP
jgi:hypothetical protein